MKKIHLIMLSLSVAALVLSSCGSSKKIVLLNDINSPAQYKAPQRQDLRIKKGDNLQIVVAHHDPTVVRLFEQITMAEAQKEAKPLNTYPVSSAGYVHLPLIDSVCVVGMTCNEVSALLVKKLEEGGIAYGATVTVKIAYFKVTVIGETGPGVYLFEDDGATIFDLMAKANIAGGTGGDVRRDKILIMREEDSVWQTDMVSLLTTDIFYSPYFYLQQNDVYYVYPSKTTIWRSDQRFDFVWQRITTLTSVVSLALSVLIYSRIAK